MEIPLVIITVVVVAIGYVLYTQFPDTYEQMKKYGEGLWNKLTGLFGKKEGEEKPLLGFQDGPSVSTKLQTAEQRIMESVYNMVSNYGTPEKVDMDNLSNELGAADEKLQTMVLGSSDPDAELARIGPDMLIEKAVKCAKKMIYKMGSPEGAEMAEGDLKMKVKPEIADILNFDIAKNNMSVNNIIENQNDVRQRIGGDSIFRAIWKDQTGRDFLAARDVTHFDRRHQNKKVDLSKMPTNGIINVLVADNPSLFNNNALLPNLAPKDLNDRPVNMELANIIASQNRFYENGTHNVIRNRGGDDRPLPKALVDKIMTQGNSRDPNSLQMAASIDLIDVLETGRGAAGNEYLDKAIDTWYRTTDNDYIKQVEVVSQNNIKRGGSLRNGRMTENYIIDDIKNGKHKIELPV